MGRRMREERQNACYGQTEHDPRRTSPPSAVGGEERTRLGLDSGRSGSRGEGAGPQEVAREITRFAVRDIQVDGSAKEMRAPAHRHQEESEIQAAVPVAEPPPEETLE